MKRRDLKPGTVFRYDWDVFGMAGPMYVGECHPSTPDQLRGYAVSRPGPRVMDDDVTVLWAPEEKPEPKPEPKPEQWLVVVVSKDGSAIDGLTAAIDGQPASMAVVRDTNSMNYRFFTSEDEAAVHAKEKAQHHPHCDYFVLRATQKITQPAPPPLETTRL